MTRQELEHIIRASAATANVRDIVVIGSQAILGAYPDAPRQLRESMEADVFPKDAPDRSNVIDGAIGELSLFHESFGYHAHGVDETTATLPEGWRERLIRIESPNLRDAVGWCLEPHDLAVSKLAAGRVKDFTFARLMVEHKLVDPDIIRQRLGITPRFTAEARELAMARLDEWSRH